MNYWITGMEWGPGIEDKPTETFVEISDSETEVRAAIDAQLQSQFGKIPEHYDIGGQAEPNNGIFGADPDDPTKVPVTGPNAKTSTV